MCFTCSSFSCCASFKKTASKSKINGGSGESLENLSAWRRKPTTSRVVLKQLRSRSGQPRPLPPVTPKLGDNEMATLPHVQKKIQALLDENLYEDVKNANLVGEEGRRAPSGTPQDLLEQWVIGLRMDCAKNADDPDEDSTSFSDMSTQTEWAMPLQGDDADRIRSRERILSETANHVYDIPRTRLTNEEVRILESRLNWLGGQIRGRRPSDPQMMGDRRSVTMPNESSKSRAIQRSSVRSLTGGRGGGNDAALDEFRRELANASSMAASRLRRRKMAEGKEEPTIEEASNDLDVSDTTTTSDNNKIPVGNSSAKRSSGGTCSCSNSSCGCSCCSDAWWLNESETRENEAVFKGKALTPVEEKLVEMPAPRGERPEPEGEETKMEEDSSSSGSSGYEEWRGRGTRKERATTLSSTATSSSNNWTPPESDEWVFVVSTSISSNAPEAGDIRLARRAPAVVVSETKKGDSLGYGTLPPSDSDLILAAKTEMTEPSAETETNNKIPEEKKRRGIAYFRKKISEKRRDKKRDEPLPEKPPPVEPEAPPSPAPPIVRKCGGKVLAEVARINSNRRPQAENLIVSRLGNENAPKITSALIRERTSSLGRSFNRRPPYGKYEPKTIPDRAVQTSPETTPTKRSARKQRLLRERAMQIEVERSQMTTDEEEGSALEDPDWMARGTGRRRRRSRTFSGERRRVAFAPQAPGIGQLLMVQAECGQNSVLGRDNVHITAV